MIIGNIVYQKTIVGLLEKDVPSRSFISRIGYVLHSGLVFREMFGRSMVLEYMNFLFNEFSHFKHIIRS